MRDSCTNLVFRTPVALSRSLLTVLLAATVFPASAAAAFPGANGDFIVSLNRCYDYDSYLAHVPLNGGEITPLGSTCDDHSQDPPPFFDHRSPQGSPDGHRVAAVQASNDESGFTSMAPDGSDKRLAPMPAGVDFPFFMSYAMAPAFAPDGDRFVFDDGTGGLWRARFSREDLSLIRGSIDCGRQGAHDDGRFSRPRWSPDGRLLAVQLSVPCRRDRPPVKSGLWLMRARDGKLVRRIAGARAVRYDWAPDGRRLVYSTLYQQREVEGGASGGNLYVVSRDGTRRRTLVHREDIAEWYPTWSPDGRWVAWVSLRFSAGDVGFDAKASIWRVRSTGRGRERVRGLPDPYVEEGGYHPPELTWLTAP